MNTSLSSPSKGPTPQSGAKHSVEEENLKMAIAAIYCSGSNPISGRYCLPIKDAAILYNVCRHKLGRRLRGIGVSSRAKAHHGDMLLTWSQEETLKIWLKAMARRSIPWTRSLLFQKAELIAGKPVGKCWVSRFIKRNPDIKTMRTSPIDANRCQALNQTSVNGFYDALYDLVRTFKIKHHNIYNVDEKGIQMGVVGRQTALVDRNQKTVSLKQDGNKELATIIECVAADGKALQPLVIMKGMRVNPLWGHRNEIHARYVLF